jgi:hypothetical protein
MKERASMGDGFEVNPAALRDAASRITDAVVGMAATQLANLAAPASDFGHDGVHQALIDFCSGVELSAQILAQTSESASTALHDTARSYTDRDLEAQAAVQKVVGEIASPNGPADGGR